MSTLFDTRQSRNRSALSMIGSAADALLNSILSSTDSTMAKLYEDRNAILSDGGLISFSLAGVLTFTQNLNILINSRIAGGSPLTISLGSTTRTFANLDMLYAVVDRTGATATLTLVNNATGLPAITSTNNEVFLIAKRFDSADGTVRLYFRGGFSLSGGQTSRLNTSSSFYASEFSAVDKTDPTKKILLQASGSTTGTTLTLASAVTANRVLTFPDVTDTLVARSSIDVLSNKTFADAITLDEIVTPSNPSAGQLKFYSKNDDGLYYLNSAGIETKISNGSLPSRNVVTKTSAYVATVNDDIILVDSSAGQYLALVSITLPNPVGNTGKELVIKKIDASSADNNRVPIIGSIDGGSNDSLWVQHETKTYVSDGTIWRTLVDKERSKTFQMNTPISVVAASTANVSLATLATGTVIDHVTVRNGDLVLLQNQTTNSENGVWIVGNTAGATVRLLEANNGTKLNNFVVYANYFNYDLDHTGVNIALHRYIFTVANTVNATAGAHYTNNGSTFTVERTLNGYTAITANTPLASAAPTISGTLTKTSGGGDATIAYSAVLAGTARALSGGTPTNHGKYFFQNNLLVDDASPANWGTQSWATTSPTIGFVVPLGVTNIRIHAVGNGGGGRAATDGSGGTGLSGGTGGCGVLPIEFDQAVATGELITMQFGAPGLPGNYGGTATQAGGAGLTMIISSTGGWSYSITGGNPGSSLAAPTTASIKGGPIYTNGGASAAAGESSFWSVGGSVGENHPNQTPGGGGGGGKDKGGDGGASGGGPSAGTNNGQNGAGGTRGSGGGGGGSAGTSFFVGRGGFGGNGYFTLSW